MPSTPTSALSRRDFVSALGLTAASLTLPGDVWAASQPKKILFVGDSMVATAFGDYLEKGMEGKHGYKVQRRGKSSTGLARPDFFNWLSEGTKLRKKYKPEAVIVMMGGNDTQALNAGKHKWIKWGDEQWAPEYNYRVSKFIDIVAGEKLPLFWVGLPIPRSPKYRRKLKQVNSLIEAQVSLRSNARFISTWNALATPDGRYTDKIIKPGSKSPTVVREADGIHLTMAGARILEQYVRPRIHGPLSKQS